MSRLNARLAKLRTLQFPMLVAETERMKIAPSLFGLVLISVCSTPWVWAKTEAMPSGSFKPDKNVERVVARFSASARARFKAVDASADAQGFRELPGSQHVRAGTGELRGKNGLCTYVLVTRDRRKGPPTALLRTVAHIEVTCKGVKETSTLAWIRTDQKVDKPPLKKMKDEYSDPDERRDGGGAGSDDGAAGCMQSGVVESCGTSALACITAGSAYPSCLAAGCVGGTFATVAYCSAKHFLDRFL